MSGFPVLDFYSDGLPNSLKLLIVDSIQSPAQFLVLNYISAALRAARPVSHSIKSSKTTSVLNSKYSSNHNQTTTGHHRRSQFDHLGWRSISTTAHRIIQSILPKQLGLDFSLILVFHDDLVKSNQRDRVIFNHLVNRSDIIIRTRAIEDRDRVN
ncbi:hypothetical protein H4Q26_012818 [Puccinia striiformis f. sp. tritici PST-130]|nr:hypothetical protein H4Q26_012818 [Puccinia striiformis f. sp. tritici PST-130]